MKPHKCPVCDGRGVRPDDSTECVPCAGVGVVWEKTKGDGTSVVWERTKRFAPKYIPMKFEEYDFTCNVVKPE